MVRVQSWALPRPSAAGGEVLSARLLPDLERSLQQSRVEVLQGAPGDASPRAGTVRWSCPPHHHAHANRWLAWAWCEVSPEVFAIDDPLAIKSSFLIVGEAGDPVPANEHLVLLNRMIRRIPWQTQLCTVLPPQSA